MNLRVSLITTATLGLAAGLALATPARPETGTPFPAAALALAAQAATALPAIPAPRPPAPKWPAAKPAMPATASTGASKVRYSPGCCLVWVPKQVSDDTHRSCLITPSFAISPPPIMTNVGASG